MRRRLWPIVYYMALISFTVYVLMDTFVITRVYTVVQDTRENDTGTDLTDGSADNDTGSNHRADENTDGGTDNGTGDSTDNGTADNTDSIAEQEDGAAEAVVTDTSYSDSHIQISIIEYRESDTTIYAAEIALSSAEYLKTALAQDSYGRNLTEKTSEMAADKNAILAVNGDYYGVQESGYVLRNGVLYRDKADKDQEDLVIYADGSFEIIRESEISAQTLLDKGAAQILSFGPALVENGGIVISENDEVGKAMASNPRTAIAVLGELHYLFLVSDGRTDESAGLSLYELASFAQGLGAQTVYNLDGGGSSTMYFNGQVINKPTTNGRIHERSVSDIVYIGY